MSSGVGLSVGADFIKAGSLEPSAITSFFLLLALVESDLTLEAGEAFCDRGGGGGGRDIDSGFLLPPLSLPPLPTPSLCCCFFESLSLLLLLLTVFSSLRSLSRSLSLLRLCLSLWLLSFALSLFSSEGAADEEDEEVDFFLLSFSFLSTDLDVEEELGAAGAGR